MKKVLISVSFLIIATLGCDLNIQIANDPPSSLFSFGFKGRLEKLEDVFYSSNLSYREFNYNTDWQKDPEYEFKMVRSDTIIYYTIILQDCQSIYYLVNWNDHWHCDSSYIHIDKYESNMDSIPEAIAKSIFDKEIIQPLRQKFDSTTYDYHWKVEKSNDTTYVKVLSQNNTLRKLYVYSFDSVGNSIAGKEIFNYLGDSTIHYKKSQSQRYMYLESREIIYHKNSSR